MQDPAKSRALGVVPRLALALVSLLAADLLAGLLLVPAEVVGFRRPHPWYHHGLVASRSGKTRWGSGEPYAFATNSLGCVDRSPRDVPLTSDKRRIVLLGDSFTEGIGVTFAQSFAGLLEERLASDDVELLNAGVTSFSPKLYRLRLEHLLRQVGLHIDELVVLIDMSDVQDEVLYRYFQPHMPGALERTQAWLWRQARLHSFLLHTLDTRLAAARRNELRRLCGVTSFPPWLDYFWLDNIDADPLTDPTFMRVRVGWADEDMRDNRWSRLGVELALEDMNGLVELCREFSIPLSIVVYPWPGQIRGGDEHSRQIALWQEFCAAQGATFVNLFPAFLSAGDRTRDEICDTEFLAGDVHWNADGHRRVADALEPLLRVPR